MHSSYTLSTFSHGLHRCFKETFNYRNSPINQQKVDTPLNEILEHFRVLKGRPLTILVQCHISIPPENVSKPKVF